MTIPFGRSGAVKRISTERAERLVSRGGRTASGAARMEIDKVEISHVHA